MTGLSESGMPMGGAENVPVQPHPQSWRLLLTLGGAGALAGLLIVLAYDWTRPRIDAHNAKLLRAAIEEVLHSPQRTDTIYLDQGALTDKPAAATDRSKLDRIYKGYAADGHVLGYAISTSEAGFVDQIGLIIGYDPAQKQVLGLKILSSKETPGLGDKIERPTFTAQFASRIAPLVGVKGKVPSGDKSAIEMITGATISSRTVIREINNAAKRWQPLLEKYQRGQK
ncbi:MAG: FMN-binding protein [Gemmatimonadaceae bacterium]|nr:FMN-binding protein [Gemmatimonadaceae bacterium]